MTPPSSGYRLTTGRGAAALVLLTLLLYAGSLGGGFVWDDEYIFFDNPRILSESVRTAFTSEVYWYVRTNALIPHYTHYRPVQMLSYSWLARIMGMSPFGMHLASVLLHAAAAVLLFLIVLEFAELRVAWFTAALFVAHPLHVEAVAWMSVFSEVLCATLMLSSLYTLLRARRGSAWLLAASYACAIAALLTKETALTLPLLVALFAGLRSAWPFFALDAGYLIARYAVLGPSAPPMVHRSVLEHLRVVLIAALGYARKLVWPWPLAPEYQVSHGIIAWVIFAIACIAAAWAASRYSRVGFALLLAIIPLGPALAASIAFPSLRLVQDRSAYLAVMGIALLLAMATRRRAGLVAVAALLVVWATLSVFAVRNWRDPEALWTHTLKVTPNSRTAVLGLGDWYYSTRRFADAERVYRQGLTLRPDDPDYKKSLNSVQRRDR